MSDVRRILIIFVALVEMYSQQFVGDVCPIKSSRKTGLCKLFSQCEEARDDLKKFSRLPDVCGFEGIQPIVCCKRKPGDISKIKCREYGGYVYEKRNNVTREECGHKVVQLIVGGEKAGRKEFPHMAAIGFESTPDEIHWSCGGTLLSENYVLTAAHCLHSFELGPAKWVKLGVTALNDTVNHQQIEISDRKAHPEYQYPSHYHDIGLVKLSKPVKMNSFARPACLYLKPEISAEVAIATGWGHTTLGGSASNDLMKVMIDLVDHERCNSSYKKHVGHKLRSGIVRDTQFCAGLEEEKDTCQGDSGGPLQIYHVGDNVKCMYDIIGITSFGLACGIAPAVYVRISHYIKWIEDIVWPYSE